MNANVKYTPGNQPRKQWSQSPDKKLKVGSGTTPLSWTIQVIPASAGAIIFNNTDATLPGIQFTGIGNSAWPGAPPRGDANTWTSSINDTLAPGADPVSYHYCVNALYTPANGTQVAVKYDPDVEEDPPRVAVNDKS